MGQLVADGSIRALLAAGEASVKCPRITNPYDGEEPIRCDTEVPLHGLHWVAEVCPSCLQTFRWGSGADYSLYTDYGFWDGEGQKRIRANIAKNGGRYIPEFR